MPVVSKPEGERLAAPVPQEDPEEIEAKESEEQAIEEEGLVFDEKIKRDAAEAKSLTHLMTHDPNNPFCDVCMRAKHRRRRRSSGAMNIGPKPERFGDQVTGDVLIKNKTFDRTELDPKPISAGLQTLRYSCMIEPLVTRNVTPELKRLPRTW